MNKLFSVFSVSALLFGAIVPMHAARAANAGNLIKCDATSAVYYLADDGARYVFPNEKMYHSWYPDFTNVRTISCTDLAALPLGDRIVYQAGTRLIKIPSDPSVFAVEDDGVLREIPDEETAIALYGKDWNKRVDDVSEAFWSSFSVGAPLAEDEIPAGTILEDEDGDLFKVEDDGTATEVDSVLSLDQEDVLKEHALSLDDVERKLGIALALTRVDAAAAIAVLEGLIADLKTVHVSDDEKETVEDIPEVEDLNDAAEKAWRVIEHAEEEITKAEEKIAKWKAEGADVTESLALIATAREHLTLAQGAFAADNNALARTEAKSARHDAMLARGKAADAIEQEDDDAEDTSEEGSSDETGSSDEDETSSDSSDSSGSNSDDSSSDTHEDSSGSDSTSDSGSDSGSSSGSGGSSGSGSSGGGDD